MGGEGAPESDETFPVRPVSSFCPGSGPSPQGRPRPPSLHKAKEPMPRPRLSKSLFSIALPFILATTPSSVGATQEPAPPSADKGSHQEANKVKGRLETGTVVIATRVPDDPFEVPLSITSISREEFLEHNSRTAADALRFKPGIWVQKTGHLGGAPILRGFMGNRVVYMFDGIRRNTAGLFKGPNSFLQNVDALDIDRIEVIRGPGSVLYGSDAIGGVVDVRTNEEPAFSASPTRAGRLYTRFGSADNEMSVRAEASVSTKDTFAFLGGTYRDIGDLRGGRGVGVQSPSGWREKNFDGQFNMRLDEGSSVELFYQDFSRPRGRRYDRPNWKQSNDRELLGVRYRAGGEGPVQNLEVTGYYHNQEGFIDEKYWDSDTDDETLGFDIQATSFPTDATRLVYGFHIHKDDIAKSNPQKGTVDPTVSWTNPAAFMLSEWQVNDRLRVDIGVRLDSFTLTSRAPSLTQLDSVMQDAINNGALSLKDLSLDETDTAVTGGVGLTYTLDEQTNLVGHIGRAFRAPNKSDLLSFGQFTFGFNVPSPNLAPESSWTYEAGIRHRDEEFSGSFTSFYTEVDDAIISSPGTFNGSTYVDVNGNGIEDPGEQVYVKENSTGTVKAFGVELEGVRRLPEAWSSPLVGTNFLSVYGNFAWIRGRDTGSGEPLDRAFPANALVGLRLEDARDPRESTWWIELESWLAAPFGRIPSSRKTSDPAFFNDPQDKNSGLIGGNGNLPGFGIINLRAGRRFGKRSTLYLGLENIGDRAYRVKDSRIDGPGLNFTVGLDIAL